MEEAVFEMLGTQNRTVQHGFRRMLLSEMIYVQMTEMCDAGAAPAEP